MPQPHLAARPPPKTKLPAAVIAAGTFAEHPIRSYVDSGLFVTLNSDDPPMFGSSFLDEYVLAQTEYDFTPDQLREQPSTSIRGGSIAANAAEASFLPPHQKLALLSRIEQYQ